jgi:hypothetical protein
MTKDSCKPFQGQGESLRPENFGAQTPANGHMQKWKRKQPHAFQVDEPHPPLVRVLFHTRRGQPPLQAGVVPSRPSSRTRRATPSRLRPVRIAAKRPCDGATGEGHRACTPLSAAAAAATPSSLWLLHPRRSATRCSSPGGRQCIPLDLAPHPTSMAAGRPHEQIRPGDTSTAHPRPGVLSVCPQESQDPKV